MIGVGLLRFRRAGEGDELLGDILVLCALRDHPVVEVVDGAGPRDREVLAFALRGVDAAVVDGGHHDVTGDQELRRLCTGFPPLDVALQLIELLECAIHAFLGRQDLVHVLGRHTVSHQRELEVVARALAHAALAGILLHIPEIGPALRRGLQLVGVVAEHGRPHEGAEGALMESGGNEVGLVAELAVVHLFQQAFFAGAADFAGLDFHQVPAHLLRFDHRLQLGHFAVVFDDGDLVAGGFLERRDVSSLLRIAVGAAEIDDGQFASMGESCGCNSCCQDGFGDRSHCLSFALLGGG